MLAALPVTLIGVIAILPLTVVSLRLLHVPPHHELVAGIFFTIVYALLASVLLSLAVI